MRAAQPFLRARDFLLAHRSTTTTPTRFPLAGARPVQLGARLVRRATARGNDAPGAAGRRRGRQRGRRGSFAELAERSNRVANCLRALGVRRGDRMLLMLGNVVAAVGDHAGGDEARRGGHPGHHAADAATTCATASSAATSATSIADAADAGKFAGVPGDYTRIAVGRRAPPAGIAYADGRRRRGSSRRTARPAPPIRCCSTSPPARPRSRSWCCTRHQSYPVGHLSTMYWIGLRAGRRPLNICSPGWAKHAWSCFFAPWNAGATVFIYNYARFDARGAARRARALRRDHALRAADRLAHADPGGSRRSAGPTLREVVGAGEPLNPEVIEQVQRGLGPHDPRRLRPDRDHGADRQLRPASRSSRARWAGRCPATASRCSTPTTGRGGRGRDLRSPLDPPPLGLMAGYTTTTSRAGEAHARRLLPHRRRRRARRRRLHHLRRPRRRRVQEPRTTGSARSSWRAR